MKSNIIKFALVAIIAVPLLALNNLHYQFNEDTVPSDSTNGLPFDLEHAINVGVDIHERGIGNLDWQGEKVDNRGGTLGAYTEAVNIFNGTNYTIREVYDVLVKAHPELLTTGKQPYKCTDVNDHYNFSVSYNDKYTVSEVKELLGQGKLVQRMVETNKWRGSNGQWLSWPGSHTGLIFYYDGTYFHMKAAGKIKQKNAIYTDQQLTEWMGGYRKRFVVYTKKGYETNQQTSKGFDLEHAINVTADPHSKETENLPWHGSTLGSHAGMITAYVDAINILHGTNYTLLEVYNRIISAHPEQKDKNVAVYKNEDINAYYKISVSYNEYKPTIDNVKNALSEGKVVADIARTTNWRNGEGKFFGKTADKPHTGLIFYFDGTYYHMKTSVQKNAIYTEAQLIDWLKDTGDELIIYSRIGGSTGNSETSYTPLPSSNTPLNTSAGFRDEWYNGTHYYISVPDNPTEAMPLVVFLHGSGENSSFKKLGGITPVKYVKKKEPYKIGKFVFIAPHSPGGSWGKDSTQKKLMELIEKTANDYRIDKNRIILAGMSRGAMGVWSIAGHYPNYFAGIVPVSNQAAHHIDKYLNLPIFAMAGNKKGKFDEPEINRKMKKIIDEINRKSGKNLARFITIDGETHGGAQNKGFVRRDLYEWMLAQRKN